PRPNFFNSSAMASSSRVKSATSVTAFIWPSFLRTGSMLMLLRKLTWQVVHQSAVKSTRSGRPSARVLATASGLHGFHSSSGARVNARATTVPVTRTLATMPSQRRFRPRCTNSPQIQADIASATKKTPNQNTSLLVKWLRVNLNSQMTVASIGKPIAILNFSIHTPGFGRNFSQSGRQLNTTYGAASPKATANNVRTMTADGCVNANPSATPRNGAVQGVASKVASTPLKNAPAAPPRDASSLAAPMPRPLRVTSKTPNEYSPPNNTSIVIGMRNCSFWNCIPQLGTRPASFTMMTSTASTRNETRTPNP